MSQGSLQVPTVGVVSGLTMAQDINNALAALYSANSGSSAPTNAAGGTPVLGQVWIDTTSATKPVLKQYTGSAWVPKGVINVTNGIWTPPIAGGIATTIASATTTDLGSVPEAYVTVSGVVTITGLGSSAIVGSIHAVTFSGILTLTHNGTSLILPTSANITTAAGDCAWFVMMTAGNWRCLGYQLASGAPLSTTAVGAQQLVASAQGMNMPLNLRINATVGASALTVAIKTAANADASASSPVLIPFRDATVGNGDPVIASLQAALSITVASTNTMGAPSGSIAFRLWVIAYYNAGTVAVGVINCSTFTAGGLCQIYPLNEAAVVTTAASTNGGSALGTFYANVSAITNTPFRILGYLDWGSGLATAGTWASAPTTIQLMGPGIKKPGDIVQNIHLGSATSGTASNSTGTAVPFTSGTLFQAITPSAAPNPIRVELNGSYAGNGTNGFKMWLGRGSTGSTTIGQPQALIDVGGIGNGRSMGMTAYDLPNAVTASTYAALYSSTQTDTITFPSTGGGGTLTVAELMG